jgi:hypothetical protein
MPIVLLVVVAAAIVLLAAFAPRTFQRLRGKIAARVQLRDGLAWRGDTPPGAPVNTLQPGVWRVTDTPTWDENTGAWTMGGVPVWRGGKNDPVTGVWQVMIVVDQAGGVAILGVPVKPGDASYGLVAERVARTLADSIGITWKQH